MTTTPRPQPPQLRPVDWTDEELLTRLLLRDGLAWREFHRRFDRLIHCCIQKVTRRFGGVVTEEDAREIYAQFLVEITKRDMQKLRAYRPDRGSKLSSWLGLLARNVAWDHVRKVTRRPACQEFDEASAVCSGAVGPFEELASKERLKLVQAAVTRLSAKDQQFMRLYFVEGLSPDEVAERMQVSVKTVYTKKHKIRARLREAVGAAA